MSKRIRILIADDHKLIRAAIRVLLEAEAEFEVVGEAADGFETIVKAQTLKPDVILMDIQMPHKNGIEAIEEIKRENPHACILVLTSYADEAKVFTAMKAGALGYMLKEAAPDDLLQAIRSVNNGEFSLHPTIARILVQELHHPTSLVNLGEPLTDREAEVLFLVARGLSNQEVAEVLAIRERTVSTHVSNILNKLNLANRTQATLYALKEGLITLDQVHIS